METLIIFLIFIAYSVIKSLGKKETSARRPKSPVPPGTPLPGKPEHPRPVAVPLTKEHEPSVQLRFSRPVKKSSQEPAVQTEPVWQMPAETAILSKGTAKEVLNLRLEPEAVLLGVVFSEVLGKPRSKKPIKRNAIN